LHKIQARLAGISKSGAMITKLYGARLPSSASLDDLPGEVARLRAAGAQFRNDIVTGPGTRSGGAGVTTTPTVDSKLHDAVDRCFLALQTA
jgi:hypothetical protein